MGSEYHLVIAVFVIVIIYEAICERQGCLEKKIAHYFYTY